MALFEINNLTFRYPLAQKEAIRHLSLTLHEGEFVVLCGRSGSGKSTLLRHLKPALTPNGERTGEIVYDGILLVQVQERTTAAQIGFVQQSPENQLVTDRVWHELAFLPESLGLPTDVIRRRVAEMAEYFGISSWFQREISTLSGGQKQLLCLAGAMVTNPRLLILDEPTAQLDPVAAMDFLHMLSRINQELGVTVLLSEHRLEEALPMADRVIVMEEGCVLADGTPAGVGETLRHTQNGMFAAMPAAMQIWSALPSKQACPVSVREGRSFLKAVTDRKQTPAPICRSEPPKAGCVLKLEDVWFRYEKNAPDVIAGLSMEVYGGSLHAVVGGNGAGKSTLLALAAGLYKPYRGKITLFDQKITAYSPQKLYGGTVALLPQDPTLLFAKKTVGQDLAQLPGVDAAQVQQVAAITDIAGLLDRHPYDLSGGEQQRAALAKLLLKNPRLLLLDEPTKGLDAAAKEQLARLLLSRIAHGTTILMVSHDVEFCARYAHWCTFVFDKGAVSTAPARAFFAQNSFYTTAANRISRGIVDGAVTVEEVVTSCQSVM